MALEFVKKLIVPIMLGTCFVGCGSDDEPDIDTDKVEDNIPSAIKPFVGAWMQSSTSGVISNMHQGYLLLYQDGTCFIEGRLKPWTFNPDTDMLVADIYQWLVALSTQNQWSGTTVGLKKDYVQVYTRMTDTEFFKFWLDSDFSNGWVDDEGKVMGVSYDYNTGYCRVGGNFMVALSNMDDAKVCRITPEFKEDEATPYDYSMPIGISATRNTLYSPYPVGSGHLRMENPNSYANQRLIIEVENPYQVKLVFHRKPLNS